MEYQLCYNETRLKSAIILRGLLWHNRRSTPFTSGIVGSILTANSSCEFPHDFLCEKSQSTLCRKSCVFSGFSGFLPQGMLTG